MHRLDESIHVGLAHGHGSVGLASFHVAILQGADLADDWVEHLSARIDEEKVGDAGHLLQRRFPESEIDALLQRGEQLVAEVKSLLLEEFIGGILGVRTL